MIKDYFAPLVGFFSGIAGIIGWWTDAAGFETSVMLILAAILIYVAAIARHVIFQK